MRFFRYVYVQAEREIRSVFVSTNSRFTLSKKLGSLKYELVTMSDQNLPIKLLSLPSGNSSRLKSFCSGVSNRENVCGIRK